MAKNRGHRGARTAALAQAKALQNQAPSATADTYSNFSARLGAGTGNLASQGSYPLTRFTQQYMTILAMYRSHWIVRKIVDVMAEDMLKHAPVLNMNMKPAMIKKFDKVLRDTGTIEKLLTTLKWGRLFGGGVAIIVIEGHKDLSKPLKIDDIDLDSYRGLIPLDRWAGVFPDQELVTDINACQDFGLPVSYKCNLSDQTATEVHHSRIIRFVGRPLPEWERQVEMFWGLSEIEVVFDELQKRDYASWNIVSMLTRAQIIAMKDPQLAQKQSGASMNQAAWNQYVGRMDMMSQSMNNQGLLILDKDGGIESTAYSFGGLAELYDTFMADIAGAAEIPMSRLYGRNTGGLGSNGEGDLQLYYDLIETKRKREIFPALDKLLPIICMSTFGQVPEDFDYTFPPLRTMTNKERAELAKATSDAIVQDYQADLITKREARMELKQAADDNGLFSNITDAAVAKTPDKYASEVGGGELDLPEEAGAGEPADAQEKPDAGKGGKGGKGGGERTGAKPAAAPAKSDPEPTKPTKGKAGKAAKDKAKKKSKGIKDAIAYVVAKLEGANHGTSHSQAQTDASEFEIGSYTRSASGEARFTSGDRSAGAQPTSAGPDKPTFTAVGSVEGMAKHHGLPIVVETPKGATRRGFLWRVNMPADYGYIKGVPGADGDDLDCYVGKHHDSDSVFVVDQNFKNGRFDEHKVMLGYNSKDSALADYMAGHSHSLQVFRNITAMSMPEFKTWMLTCNITQPCASEKAGLDDAEFKEDEHPRAKDGKFATAAGGGSGSSAPTTSMPAGMGHLTKGGHKHANQWILEQVKKGDFSDKDIEQAAIHLYQAKTVKAIMSWAKKKKHEDSPAGQKEAAAKAEGVAKNNEAITEAATNPALTPEKVDAALTTAEKKDYKSMYVHAKDSIGKSVYLKVSDIPEGLTDKTSLNTLLSKQGLSASIIAPWDASKPTPPNVQTVAMSPELAEQLKQAVYEKAAAEAKLHKVVTVGEELNFEIQKSIKHYTNGSYKSLNISLRSGQPLTAEQAKLASDLDKAIKKHKLAEPVTVYRGLAEPMKYLGPNPTIGTVLVDNGFMSTSKNDAKAKNFAAGGMLAVMKLPKGSPGIDVSALSLHPTEKEVLLPRGSMFKVVGIIGKTVELEYVNYE